MMTLIVVISFALILFIGLLRYDIHKNKYRDQPKQPSDVNDKDTPTKA